PVAISHGPPYARLHVDVRHCRVPQFLTEQGKYCGAALRTHTAIDVDLERGPRPLRRYRQCRLDCFQADLRVRMIIKAQESAALIASARFQLLRYDAHLVKQPIEPTDSVFKERMILRDSNFDEPCYQLTHSEMFKIGLHHPAP